MKKRLLALAIGILAAMPCCTSRQAGKASSSPGLYSDEVRAVLGRGLVSFRSDRDQVFLSWRLLPEDPSPVSFKIYRKEVGGGGADFNYVAQTDRTSYVDRIKGGKRYVYAVRAVKDGKELSLSRVSIELSSFRGNAALVFDLGEPYRQARVVTGDLNGDGEPEVIVAYSGNQHVDPYEKAWSKSEDTIKVAAFRPTGERLWKLDLGWGIEAGFVYQPMVVWDLDGDGRAELILKTNRSAGPRDYTGERVTVLDGMSGQVKRETNWPSLKGLGSDYNNDSRNFLAIAHLDGKDPFVIAARGIYKTQKIWAFDKTLHRVWERTPGIDHNYPSRIWDRLIKFWNIDNKKEWLRARLSGKPIVDQRRASHRLPIADIDDDGKEEILWGERCIGENGTDLWAIEEKMPYLGHPDIVFPARILPPHKGKEVYFGREGWAQESDQIGVYVVDHHGKILWARWGYTHIDRGWAAKIVPDQAGLQCLGIDIVWKEWSPAGASLITPTGFLWGFEGNLLGNRFAPWYWSFPADWDGDGVREIVTTQDGKIQKYGGSVLQQVPSECIWGADLFGDHREEIVAAPGDGKICIFFNARMPNGAPRVTPMADRQYKNDLSRTANGEIIPMEGGFIPGRPTIPKRP